MTRHKLCRYKMVQLMLKMPDGKEDTLHKSTPANYAYKWLSCEMAQHFHKNDEDKHRQQTGLGETGQIGSIHIQMHTSIKDWVFPIQDNIWKFNRCSRVEELQKWLKLIRDIAGDKEIKSMKDKYAKQREFTEGSMLLLRLPGYIQ